MITSDFSWILVLEIVLPFVVLSIVLIMTIIAGRKKFKQSAKMLILSVKSNEDKEKQAIFKFLTETLSIDPTLAKKKVKKIINERKFLIRNLVSGLLDKNVEALSQINQDLCRVTAKYHALELGNSVKEDVEEIVEESPEDDSDAPEDLKAEIKSLKQEVHITLTTLNNIFKEFSSMFGEDDIPEGQMSVDQIITAMESFSGKSANDGATNEGEPAEDAIEPPSDEKIEPDSATETIESDVEETEEEIDIDFSEVDEVLDDPSLLDQLDENINENSTDEQQNKEQPKESTESAADLDFSVDGTIDDIDSALDELELDASNDDADEEPDWGDAFAESGDTMEDEPKS